MDDAILVQILDSVSYLESQVLRSLLWYVEIACFEVIEQVFPLHVLKDDVVVVRVLEEIDKFNDVRVLAHLEDLYLPSLLVDLD